MYNPIYFIRRMQYTHWMNAIYSLDECNFNDWMKTVMIHWGWIQSWFIEKMYKSDPFNYYYNQIHWTNANHEMNKIIILDERNPIYFWIKVIMQGKLFQRCTHLLYCSVPSLGGYVNTRRMSKLDMGSIFHIKNQWNILVKGNYYVNYQN